MLPALIVHTALTHATTGRLPGGDWEIPAVGHRDRMVMPTRLCLEPRCPNPSAYRGRCPTHARTTNQHTHHNRRIYNSKRWATTRSRVLYEQPLCPGLPGEPCGDLAVDVHHIVDLDQGGDPWARANLLGLCKHHHSRITRQEQATT